MCNSLWILSCGIGLLLSNFALAANIEDSVVKIIAGQQSGTGFVWQNKQQQKYIVTSLHTLVGAKFIHFNQKSAATELQVYKIDKESDLALLTLKNGQLTLPALNLSVSQPDPKERYYIYGFPAGVTSVQGDSIEFSRAKHLQEIGTLLPNFKDDITQGGYPLESLKVLRVSSGITPGHSGAPIINDKDNSVIGVGAGGLSMKGFRRVNWAVPAKNYIERLEALGSNEDPRNLTPKQDAQYSHSVASKGSAVEKISANENSYYLIYQVPMSELLLHLNTETADEDALVDNETLDEIYASAAELHYDLAEVWINIYQHSESGALVYLPAEMQISDRNGLLVGSIDGDKVRFIFQVKQTDSFEEALSAKEQFLHALNAQIGSDWYLNESASDSEAIFEPEFGFWSYNYVIYQPSLIQPEVDEAETLIQLSVDFDDDYPYGDFVGVAVVAQHMSEYTHFDHKLLHQLDVCADLSGFVSD